MSNRRYERSNNSPKREYTTPKSINETQMIEAGRLCSVKTRLGYLHCSKIFDTSALTSGCPPILSGLLPLLLFDMMTLVFPNTLLRISCEIISADMPETNKNISINREIFKNYHFFSTKYTYATIHVKV